MNIYYINTGTSPNKGDGDTLRTAFNKVNTNFQNINGAINSINTDTNWIISNSAYAELSATNYIVQIPNASINLNSTGTVTISANGQNLSFNQDYSLSVPGNLTPITNGVQSLGTPTTTWANLYLGGALVSVNGNSLYVNGQIVGTANVTFQDTTIVGTIPGDPEFPNGLIRLLPNSSLYNIADPLSGGYVNYGQYVDIYPTSAETANEIPRIHIAAGKGVNSTGDLYLGDDLINVAVIHTGTINVNIYDPIQGNTSTWVFQTSGLVFPDQTVQTTAFNTSSYISKAVLKAIVSTSTSFADFQAHIAAL